MQKSVEKIRESEDIDTEFDVSKIVVWIQLYWPVVTLVLFFSLFYLVYTNFFTADLGRHIVNGREIVSGGLAGILKSGEIFNTNYYSFTQTDFPFTNHHWLFGVVVFFLHKIGGFSLLTWFNTILNSFAFVFILLTAVLSAKKNIEQNELRVAITRDAQLEKTKLVVSVVTVTGFLLLPLLTHRTEIRPESLSLLFFALYSFLFRSFNNTATLSIVIQKKKWLIFSVLVFQIIWTNSHLFFILGPLLASYFLFERILILLFPLASHLHVKALLKTFRIIVSDSLVKFWLILFSSSFAVGILNPNGIQGLLAPLNIFDNYAYRVAENQSTFFMINYGSQVVFFSFVVVCSVFALLLGIFSLLRKKVADSIMSNAESTKSTGENFGAKIAQFILVAIFAVLANKINRLTPFFAVIAIPFIVQNTISYIEKNWTKNKEKLKDSFAILVSSTLFFILLILLLQTKLFFPSIEIVGTGLPPGIQNAAQFFIQNNLRGPIFNNYDIGGYLAFNLFPQEKLFIDNRPEAYSADFLTNEFLPSFTDDTAWQNVLNKYKLNVIFFYRHDQIDGAQQFLFTRVTDPEWVPVYVDEYALILVKNSESNRDTIEKFKLPEELFNLNSN